MKIQLVKESQVVINKSELKKISLAEDYLNNEYHINADLLTKSEINKKPLRSDIINFILEYLNRETCYLEIGVRHRHENFDLIQSKIKYSVDPGYESEINNVDFKMTSDEFFSGLREGNFLNPESKFDVIFIDGSHLAEQVQKDINNALEFLKDDGFIVMHDCNPPTEFHAAENYYYRLSPSGEYWNGTTWKAFFNARKRDDIFSCCVDTDWGIGVITIKKNLGKPSTVKNDFFEYHIFSENRKDSLNLISIDQFKSHF